MSKLRYILADGIYNFGEPFKISEPNNDDPIFPILFVNNAGNFSVSRVFDCLSQRLVQIERFNPLTFNVHSVEVRYHVRGVWRTGELLTAPRFAP